MTRRTKRLVLVGVMGLFLAILPIVLANNAIVLPPKYDVNSKHHISSSSSGAHTPNNLYTLWGDTSTDDLAAITSDSAGNIYIAGYTDSFGDGSWNVFVAKYSEAETLLWNATWGGSGDDEATGIAVDSNGNVFVVGMTNFVNGSNNYDALLLKYNANGVFQWNASWNNSFSDYGRAISIDSSNNIYITGDTFNSTGAATNVFLAKFDETGTLQSTNTWGDSFDSHGYGIAIDENNNVYVTGFSDVNNASNFDALILKYSSIGSFMWNTTWGGFGVDEAFGIAVYSNQSIYITGSTTSYGAGSTDAFLARFDINGGFNWYTTWGKTSADSGKSVIIDSMGNIYIAGSTSSVGSGGYDAFLARYNEFATQLWNTTWGGSATDYGIGVTFNIANGALYLGGYTNNYGAGSYDAFIARFLPVVTLTLATPKTSLNGIIDISWMPLPGVTGYNIYRSKSLITDISGMTPLTNTTGTTYSDHVTQVGTYYYVVTTTSSLGESYPSNCQSTTYVIIQNMNNINTTWSGSKSEYTTGMTTDTAGNVYVTGYTDSFGAGSWDIFLLKYNSAGSLLWNKTWGGPGDDEGFGVAVDSNGNVFVSGSTNDYTGSNGYDAVLLKFDSNGALQWNITYGGTGDDAGRAVAIGPNNTIYMTGNYYSNSHEKLLIAVFNETGALQIYSNWGNSIDAYGESIAFNSGSSGIFFIAGYTDMNSGSNDALLLECTSGLGVSWNITWGGSGDDIAYGVAVNSNDDIFMTGKTTSFGVGSNDAFLVKYTYEAKQVWNTTWGPSSAVTASSSVVVDPSDNVYIAGTTNFDGIAGNYAFLTKYSNNGQQLWNTTWHSGLYNYGTAVAFNSGNGAIYLGGYTLGTATDSYDTFVAAYLPVVTLNTISPNPSSNGSVNLSWSQAPGVSGYNIYRSTDPITDVSGLTAIETVNGTSFTDTVSSNGTYYYTITTVSSLGESSPSNYQSVKVAISPNSSNNNTSKNHIPGFSIYIVGFVSLLTVLGVVLKIWRKNQLKALI